MRSSVLRRPAYSPASGCTKPASSGQHRLSSGRAASSVTRRVKVKYGLFSLLTREESKSERVAVNNLVTVVGPHWVLERRNHHIERNTRHRNTTQQNTVQEQHYVVLLPDGRLKKAVVYEEENLRTENGKSTYLGGHEHSLNDLSDRDVEAMDFEVRSYEDGNHGRGTKIWGDRERGRRLLSHAKGVGLTQALKRLL